MNGRDGGNRSVNNAFVLARGNCWGEGEGEGFWVRCFYAIASIVI